MCQVLTVDGVSSPGSCDFLSSGSIHCWEGSPLYNRKFVHFSSQLHQFGFMYFEAPVFGEYTLGLLYVLGRLITSSLNVPLRPWLFL